MPGKFTLHTQMAAQAYEDMLEDLRDKRDALHNTLGSLKMEPAAKFALYMVVAEFELRQKTLAIKTAAEIDLMVKAQFVNINSFLKSD